MCFFCVSSKWPFCPEVGQKLQCILRPNPKKARPSLRKTKNAEAQEAPCNEPAYSSHKALYTEVWQIDDSDSDLELLASNMAGMAANDPASSSVPWLYMGERMKACCMTCCAAAKADLWKLLQDTLKACNVASVEFPFLLICRKSGSTRNMWGTRRHS